MQFEMTEQKKAYLEARGKVILNACPGSGKTTSIAKKLILLQDECRKRNGRFSGIACLSFTNTAKDEIKEKYNELSGNYLEFPHKVSTIDSFINQYITLPYYYLFVKGATRPKILDDPSFLDEAWKGKWNFKSKNNQLICFAYPPSSIRFESDGTFSSNGYKPDQSKVDPKLFDKYCTALKSWQKHTGLITTSDSAFIGYKLLCEQPKIGNWLALRFPHIIVDEAQDNSTIQHTLFDKLIELGLSNIEFVGDPYQSLYEWRDADPKLFSSKYHDSDNWQGLDLTDDRRSPQRIIDCFSLLRKRDDPKVNTACKDDKGIPVFIYQYSETNTPHIVKHFDQFCRINGFENNQIVVRGNALKNQMLGKKADQEPWKIDLAYRIIDARHKYEGNEIKEAIKSMRSIAVSLMCKDKDYVEIKEIEQELKTDNQFNAKLLNLLHDLPKFDLTISEWTSETQDFLKKAFGLKFNLNFQLKDRNSKSFNKAILIEPLEQHFIRSYSKSNIPITTVHQVKGKTLDTILVFFNKDKHKDNITFSDIEATVQEFPSEKQRIIYVALSRPRHLLAMAFPNSISNEELKEKFGEEINIVDETELLMCEE